MDGCEFATVVSCRHHTPMMLQFGKGKAKTLGGLRREMRTEKLYLEWDAKGSLIRRVKVIRLKFQETKNI